MTSIHKVILYRLLAAWVVISLLLGVVVSWTGMRKIDRQMASIATAELRKLGASEVGRLRNLVGAHADLERLVRQFVRGPFVFGELQDAERRHLASASATEPASLVAEARRLGQAFPLATDRPFAIFSVDGHKALRVLVPLLESDHGIAGYFEGAFLIDPETLGRLRDDLVVTLLIALCAVTLTTVCLYPIILGLHRSLLRRSRELLDGNLELMEVVGSAVAKRDSETSMHNYRVATYAVRLGEEIGLKPGQMRDLIAGAFLHDVGKIGISDAILLKRGALEPQEFEEMKRHVILGVEILDKATWLQRAREVVEFHHERYNGGGYPKGLVGEEIPLLARVFAVVDVFDALISARPYKDALAFDVAMMTLRKGAGRLFDPALVASFERIAAPVYEDTRHLPALEVEQRLKQMCTRYFGATPQETP